MKSIPGGWCHKGTGIWGITFLILGIIKEYKKRMKTYIEDTGKTYKLINN